MRVWVGISMPKGILLNRFDLKISNDQLPFFFLFLAMCFIAHLLETEQYLEEKSETMP